MYSDTIIIVLIIMMMIMMEILLQSSEKPVEEKPSGESSYVVGAWPASTSGHTGYLTVATLPPAFARS